MEREILMTGIGGQGIQLATKILAQAAAHESRNVLHFGVYGGMIRGGPSDCTVVVSTEEILSPPIVEEAWAVIAMHPGSMGKILPKVRPGGVALVNSTLMTAALDRRDLTILDVPATRIAEQAGRIVGASLVALGAFVEATAIVAMSAVLEAMRTVIPPHRQSLIDFNRNCLELGAGQVRRAPVPGARAWPAS